jgi:hypothetical protein
MTASYLRNISASAPAFSRSSRGSSLSILSGLWPLSFQACRSRVLKSMRAPGFQLHQRFSASVFQAGKWRSGKWGNSGCSDRVFSIIGNLPGNDVAIAGIDVDRLLFQVLLSSCAFQGKSADGVDHRFQHIVRENPDRLPDRQGNRPSRLFWLQSVRCRFCRVHPSRRRQYSARCCIP